MKKVILFFLLILLCSSRANVNAVKGEGKVLAYVLAGGTFAFGPFLSAVGAFAGIKETTEAFKEKKWKNVLKYFGVTAAAEAVCTTLSAVQLYVYHNKAPICIKELLLLIAFYHLISGGTFLIVTLSEPVDHDLSEIDVPEILKKHVVPLLKKTNLYEKCCSTLQNVLIPTFLNGGTS